jgi:glycosyltransferase involved in cell wall biosynthesis
MNYELSYIFATRNHLPFLKITLEKLLEELQPDEEIVVVDGNSTDGTKEYLQQLFEAGKIHQFISERDRNQAHAWNKALLLAKGTIIKKIIDDDVFCYKAIRQCKDYMLLNPAVDVMLSNDLGSSFHSYKSITKMGRLAQFENWKNGADPSFTFGDVHILIRRSALALIGLYNTDYVEMDWEYSLRISYIKANIAYYTGYNALSVWHSQSITSLRDEKIVKAQGKKGGVFYEYAGDRGAISLWSEIKIFFGKLLYTKKKARETASEEAEQDTNLVYQYYYDYITELNDSSTFTFL